MCRTKPSPELSAELSQAYCAALSVWITAAWMREVSKRRRKLVISESWWPCSHWIVESSGLEEGQYTLICSPRELIIVLPVTSAEAALAHADSSVQVSHRKVYCIIWSGLQPLIVEVASAPAGRSVLTAELRTSSSLRSAAKGHSDLVKTQWLKKSHKLFILFGYFSVPSWEIRWKDAFFFFFNLNSGILEFRITFRSSTDFLSGEFWSCWEGAGSPTYIFTLFKTFQQNRHFCQKFSNPTSLTSSSSARQFRGMVVPISLQSSHSEART